MGLKPSALLFLLALFASLCGVPAQSGPLSEDRRAKLSTLVAEGGDMHGTKYTLTLDEYTHLVEEKRERAKSGSKLEPGLEALLGKVDEMMATVSEILLPYPSFIDPHPDFPITYNKSVSVLELATAPMKAEVRQRLADYGAPKLGRITRELLMDCKLGLRELFLEGGAASFIRIHSFLKAPDNESVFHSLKLLYYYGTIQVGI